MVKDCSQEVKELLNKFITNGIEFGKPIKLLSFNSGLTEEQIKKELFNLIFQNLVIGRIEKKKQDTFFILFIVRKMGEPLL